MPPEISNFLIVNKDSLWAQFLVAMFSAAGAYIIVLVQEFDDGKPMTPREAWATVFIGITVGLACSSMVGSFIGIPADKSLPIAFSALLIGMLSRRLVKLVRAIPVSLPLSGKRVE